MTLRLQAKVSWGFAFTKEEVSQVIKDFMSGNRGKYAEWCRIYSKVCQFKDNIPGDADFFYDTVQTFYKETFCPKENTENASSDPLIVYSSSDVVKNEAKRLDFLERVRRVKNIDESKITIKLKSKKNCRTCRRKSS